MRSQNVAAAKLVIAFTFTLILAAAAVMIYQPFEAAVSPQVHAMGIPSDSCVDCHTNPQVIQALATPPPETAPGGG